MNKRTKLKEGIHFNHIDIEKFKSNELSFTFIRPLNREEVTKNALLGLVLRRGTEKYIDNLTIQKRLEELYGARLGVAILIRGNKQVIKLTIEYLDSSYIDDSEYIYNIIDLLEELIYRPRLEEGVFRQDYVNQEKRTLKNRIRSKINDKREYALERAIEVMCENESFSLPNLGYIEDLDLIDERNLYSHYLRVLSESPIEIFYTGKESSIVKGYIKNKDFGSRGDVISFERETIKKQVDKVKYIREEFPVNQAKLVLGYRAGIPYEDDLYFPLVIANTIFGSGPNSKLFLNVREKESLAYYISSRVYKYKSIIILDAGIETDQYHKTMSIIEGELEKVKAGDFTDLDIEIAKKGMISSYNSIYDSNSSLTEICFGNILTNDKRSIEDKIELVRSVTREEIIEASRHITLDTVYFMHN